MTDATNTAAATTKPKLTRAETLAAKIISLQLQIASAQAELDGLTKYDNIEVGGTVGFAFGRGDEKQNLSGEVTGVGKLDNGVEVVLVLVNKGTLDASIKRIPKSSLNAYVPPVKPEPVDIVAQVQAEQAASANQGESAEALAVTNADSLLAGA